MKKTKKALLDNSIIERMNDDQLIGLMHELPDTDDLLRKAGVDQEVYREIEQDPHVMGDIRQIYSALLGFKYEVQPGDDSTAAEQAQALCLSIFKKRPHRTMRWHDLLWSIGKAPLTGRRVHALNWQEQGGKLIPAQIRDIESKKYGFNYDGELLIKSMAIPEGEIAPDMRFLVTRHMSSATNPYGLAILSSCFWPWMFKNGGLKFFVRFVERFGQPFPVGKYPDGTDNDKIDKLIESLKSLVEDAVAAIPDDESISLLESKTSGQLPQERLILLMNREMSKAITSQTAASELTEGSGSRAASQTHKDRTDQNAKADRALVEDTMNQLFEFMTIVNVGENVAPPVFKYVDKKQVNKEDVEVIKEAAALIPIKKEDVYKRFGIAEPADGDDVIFLGTDLGTDTDNSAVAQFSKSKATSLWQQEDQTVSDMIDQIKQAVEQGETLEQALDALVEVLPDLQKDALTNLLESELAVEFGKGMVEADNAG